MGILVDLLKQKHTPLGNSKLCCSNTRVMGQSERCHMRPVSQVWDTKMGSVHRNDSLWSNPMDCLLQDLTLLFVPMPTQFLSIKLPIQMFDEVPNSTVATSEGLEFSQAAPKNSIHPKFYNIFFFLTIVFGCIRYIYIYIWDVSSLLIITLVITMIINNIDHQ